MLFGGQLVLVRGGGDLGSGVAHAMSVAGFPVVVTDLAQPLTIRRAVAFSTAIREGQVEVDAVTGRLADGPADAVEISRFGVVAVIVSEVVPAVDATVIVDARLAKQSLDTHIEQAPLVVGLGPGFEAGADCHVVIETSRGHRLGQVIHTGSAEADTGVPGTVGGVAADRVIRAPAEGEVGWDVEIGDQVAAGQVLGLVGGAEIVSKIAGVVRGLITPGFRATRDLKIADIDPRGDYATCFQISDKSRLVGAGVLLATLDWLNQVDR